MSGGAEVPRPPDDIELRNIIDKLAQFVARNGAEFENMTKLKQKDNPKFQFLFGGENYHYYIYKVNTEQAIMKRNQSRIAPDQNQSTSVQIQLLQNQLQESEKNLSLQYDSLMAQQQDEIDEAIFNAERDHIKKLAERNNLNLNEFNFSLQLIQNSCSKESIATNKKWFLNNCQSAENVEILLKFLINTVKCTSSSFTFKLHILYLVNDLVHHYNQKHQNEMLEMLGTYANIMFSCAYIVHSMDETQREKLYKLRSIWLTQKYFTTHILEKLINVDESYQEYKQTILQNYVSVVNDIVNRIQVQYKTFETQHQQYSQHVKQQITALEVVQKIAPSTPAKGPQFAQQQGQFQGSPLTGPPQRRSRFDAGPSVPPLMNPGGNKNPSQDPNGAHQPIFGQQAPPHFGAGPPPGSRPPFSQHQWPPQQGDFPPRNMPPFPLMRPEAPPPLMGGIPPMFPPGPPQRPMPPAAWGQMGGTGSPPGLHQFHQQQGAPPQLRQLPPPILDDAHLIPKVPYYDLPAALMVPLVELTDSEYKPLDPTKIRLPPPMPPNERLIAAVDAFYSPPNHENPRDGDGWERLGLYEFFKAKQDAIKSRDGGGKRNGKSRRRSGSYSSTDSRRSGGENESARQRSPHKEKPGSASPVFEKPD